MMRQVLRLVYAVMTVTGLLSVLFPKQMAKLDARLMLCGFRKTGELEVKDWYADFSRVMGVGLFVSGLVGLLSTSDVSVEEPESEAETDEGESIEIES